MSGGTHDKWYLVYLIISVAVMVAAAIYAIWRLNEKKAVKHTFTWLQILGIGAAGALTALFLPCYLEDFYGDSGHFLLRWGRALLISVHHMMRSFILDGEFDIILRHTPLAGGGAEGTSVVQIAYRCWAAVLYVLAPALTFGLVLSLFADGFQRIRYALPGRKSIFLFSEVNEGSIALAKDIRSRMGRGAKLVFTDVYTENREKDQEEMDELRRMHAIYLREDITLVSLRRKKKRRMEFFLIGSDETENVRQAAKLTAVLREMPNKKVFCFASTPGSEYILDSLDKGRPLHRQWASGTGGLKEGWEKDDSYFRLRRIHIPRLLALWKIPRVGLYERWTMEDGEKVISVLLIGLGSHGLEMLRTLLWFGQMDGYRLEINIIDRTDRVMDGQPPLASRLAYEFPEIMRYNHRQIEGDARYDIEIFGDMDIRSDAFEQLLALNGAGEGEEGVRRFEMARRLRRTSTVFVMTGSDDENIESAVHLRMVFDRLRMKEYGGAQRPDPYIGAIVYDSQKARNVQMDTGRESGAGTEEAGRLSSYDGKSYDIDFFGDTMSLYHYDILYNRRQEQEAMRSHVAWANTDADASVKPAAGGQDGVVQEKVFKEKLDRWNSYEQYEYYRNSTIAEIIFWQEANNAERHSEYDRSKAGSEHTGAENCECAVCARRRTAEHVRWNAYMRSIGYVYGKQRDARAKTHPLLIPAKGLTREAARKDTPPEAGAANHTEKQETEKK